MRIHNLSYRDIIAGLLGAAIMAIIAGLAGCGPCRYQAIQVDRGCYYILDTWSGRARLWIGGDEQPMRTVRRQRHDLILKIRAEARHERDGDTDCYLCNTGGYPSEEVWVAPRDLAAFVRAHPNATPVRDGGH